MVKRLISPSRSWLPIFAALLFVGCDRGPYMVNVSGTVTLDGAELADAAIALYPIEEGPIAVANSDEQGRFALVTGDRQGVIPGKYRAAVFKTELLGVNLSRPGDYTGVTEKWITPKRYNNPETSELVYEVLHDTPDLNIELKGGK